jgi:hypothetical protein
MLAKKLVSTKNFISFGEVMHSLNADPQSLRAGLSRFSQNVAAQ